MATTCRAMHSASGIWTLVMAQDRAVNAQKLSTAERLVAAARVVAGVSANGESLDDALDMQAAAIADAC